MLTFSSSSGAPCWLMHLHAGCSWVGLFREEIPSCLVHLLRVGLWSFFPKLSHNPKKWRLQIVKAFYQFISGEGVASSR